MEKVNLVKCGFAVVYVGASHMKHVKARIPVNTIVNFVPKFNRWKHIFVDFVIFNLC